MVVTVNQCCCGCTLQRGSFLIGILEAVLSGILIVLSCAGAALLSYNNQHDHVPEPDAEKPGTTMIAIFAVSAILLVLEFVFSVLLAVGANQGNAKLVKPWIFFSAGMVCASIILSLVAAIDGFVNDNAVGGVSTLITGAISIGLAIYFIIVVNSYHRELKDRSGMSTFA